MLYIQQDLLMIGGPLVELELVKSWASGGLGSGEEEFFYFRFSDLRFLEESLILTMMAFVLAMTGWVHAVYSTSFA